MKRDWKLFFKFTFKSFKGSLIGLAIVPVIFLLLNVNHLGTESFYKGLMISFRIGLQVVLVTLIFSTIVYAVFYQWKASYLIRFNRSVKIRFAIGFFGMAMGLIVASKTESLFFRNIFEVQEILNGLTLGGIIYLLFIFKSAYRETQNFNLKLRAESAEANMNVLKNQMQPHFLFNSLNSLAELIDTNREFASQMTQNLSDLYREILESSKNLKSPLNSELAIVSKYLELESLRFGNRLNYKVNAPAHSEKILIPSLILQTLAENAIKHGISQCLTGGFVQLDIIANQNGYLVEIKNTKSDGLSIKKSTGTGLANTQARLDLFYKDQHQFAIKYDSEVTTVRFWISGV